VANGCRRDPPLADFTARHRDLLWILSQSDPSESHTLKQTLESCSNKEITDHEFITALDDLTVGNLIVKRSHDDFTTKYHHRISASRIPNPAGVAVHLQRQRVHLMTVPTPEADRQQLTRISLDTRSPRCQVCGRSFHEGDDTTVYTYRAAGKPTYEIGYLMCGTDCHEHPTVFTRGVREHVVAGHIGTCSNTQTQSMTNVLAEPIIIVTSPTTTTAVHVHPDTPNLTLTN